jgi:hypothetical protein
MEVCFGKKTGETIFARIAQDPELLEVPADRVNLLNIVF